VDTSHDWGRLVDSSYDLINASIEAPLGTTEGRLVPDWVLMDRQTGALSVPSGNLTANYGYDAMRTPWRLALDYVWNGEPRAKQTLERLSALGDSWRNEQAVFSTYTHDGKVSVREEVAEGYGTALAYFDVVDPETGKDVYEQKLASLYDQDTNAWKQPLTYYASNWVWFGIALHEDQLPNLIREVGDKE
jgi:endoglucanase